MCQLMLGDNKSRFHRIFFMVCIYSFWLQSFIFKVMSFSAFGLQEIKEEEEEEVAEWE